ncbi:hypothetical protein EVAR_83788_1 [Eumeta japonica]|uniref:Uncharacterized protein n=1 Tax=Eumeta variegata TaxID=151549 RepID=A0A4C1WHK4_EUMVA|nr:hypothetical protein EVAR_83788_1 [Eumeta japonica]
MRKFNNIVKFVGSGGARRRRRRRKATASRLKGPRKQKSFAYKLLKRGLAKSFAYKLFKRGLANLMSPTSTSGVAPLLFRRRKAWAVWATAHGLAVQRASRLTVKNKFVWKIR